MSTIKELREAQCYSQVEIMEKVGMKSRSNYSKIENRKQAPRISMRRKLAEVFGVKPTEIEW